MSGLDGLTYAYESAEGSAMEGPTFNTPRSYTFNPGKSLPLSTFGSERPNGLYCEVWFVEQGAYVVVEHDGQNIVVPQGNQPVEVGPNLLVKYDHPRVKLIPILTKGVFRTGMFLDISPAQRTTAKQAIKASQEPTYQLDIEDDEEDEEGSAMILPKNPTLVADQPEVLETYRDKDEVWTAPESFVDEFLILEGDRVLFTGRLHRRADGGRELLRENKDPLPLGSTDITRIPVKDKGKPGEPIKAMIFIENGTLKVHPLAENALQVGSRDKIYRDRLAALGSQREPLAISNTSTIYPNGSGFRTQVGVNDPERVIKMIPLGNWEAGASVLVLVRDGFVTVQNRSTSTPDVKIVRAIPNGPAVVIKDHVHVQLYARNAALTLLVLAMSEEAPIRISDSLARPREDANARSLPGDGQGSPRIPGGLRQTVVPKTLVPKAGPAGASNRLHVVPSLPPAPDEETIPNQTRNLIATAARIAAMVGAALGAATVIGAAGIALKGCPGDEPQKEVSGMAVPDED